MILQKSQVMNTVSVNGLFYSWFLIFPGNSFENGVLSAKNNVSQTKVIDKFTNYELVNVNFHSKLLSLSLLI